MTAEESKKYEILAILSGDLLEADFERELGELRKLLKENSSDVFYEESWGKRDFAYRIKKQRRGYYALFNFSAEPPAIAEIKNNLKLNQQVLRYLLIVVPDNYEPGSYKKLVVLEEEPREEAPLSGAKKKESVEVEEKPETEAKKPTVAGKEEEEHLKTVEKKLEKILENPDIDIS